MKIGTVTVQPGQKAFGVLEGPVTHGGFTAQIPLHVVRGRADGPTLLVQAGVSGLEIEPAMELPLVVDQLEPAKLTGTLIVVPLLNTSGFEFEQKNAIWDDKDLNTLGRGRADGTVSEQLIHRFFEDVVARADAVVDIHTGARWGYFRYAGVYNAGPVQESRALAIALGLPQVLLGQPDDLSMAFEAARAGARVVSAWIGGGPGLRDYREEDMRRVRNAVLNALRHLGMLDGAPEPEGPVAVIWAHTVLRAHGRRGLTFMAKEKRGSLVRTGEQVGYVMHPFSGEILEELRLSREGVMLHAGAAWPMVPEGVPLAIFGDLVEEVR
jgi:predicted deacylase